MSSYRRRAAACLLLACLSACLTACGPPGRVADATAPHAIHQARPAFGFVDSVGVNTHLSYRDTSYEQISDVADALAYLRIRHIRDGIEERPTGVVVRRFRRLAEGGVRVTGVVPYRTPSMRRLVESIREQRDFLEAVEGPNETDIFTQFRYQGQKFPRGTIAFMEDFYRAVRNTPQLDDVDVLQTTLAFPGAATRHGIRAERLGDLSAYADLGNSHDYFEFGEPPSRRIRLQHLPLNTMITPDKPMVSTEGGYQMGSGDGYKGTWDDGQSARFSQAVHGRYLLRYLLEQYRLGYQRSFVYELLSIDDSEWGLFRPDGTPLPAASGIRSLLAILGEDPADAGDERRLGSAVAAGALDFTLGEHPSSVHTLLLQKTDGTFYLVLWNDVRNWDPATGTPVARPSVPVSLEINQPVERVRTFLPLTRGTRPTDVDPQGRLTIRVPDHPVIVEVTAPQT
jgi:hypothetical protein